MVKRSLTLFGRAPISTRTTTRKHAMEALSALAIVTQKAIPPECQKAIPTTLVMADLERTRLDFERSRMAAEDQRQSMIRRLRATCFVYQTIQEALENELEDRLDERENALERLDAAQERTHEVIGVASRALHENDRLRDELQRSQESHDLTHTVPDDTEIEARRKFLKRCR